MYLVWKHRNLRVTEECLFFPFLHHLNFMYTSSVVLSKYRDFHAEIWLPSCKALLNHSTVQSNLCHFMFSCILMSSILRLILWQDKEQASFLSTQTENTHGHLAPLLVTWHTESQKDRNLQMKDTRQKIESKWQAITVNLLEPWISFHGFFKKSAWVQCMTKRAEKLLDWKQSGRNVYPNSPSVLQVLQFKKNKKKTMSITVMSFQLFPMHWSNLLQFFKSEAILEGVHFL